MTEKKETYYAVRAGRKPGIYRSWTECLDQVHRFPWADFKGFGTLKEAEQFLLSRSSAAEQPFQPAAQQAGDDKSENRGLSWTTAVAGQQSTAAKTASSTDDVIVIDSDNETEAAGAEPVSRKRKLESGPEGAAAAPLVGVDPSLVYRLEFDGASRGNPGQSGAGAVLVVDSTSEEVGRVCLGLGTATNNVAEYTGLILGMQAAATIGIQRLKAQGDSMLVVKQVLGEWQVKHGGMVALHRQVQNLRRHFREFTISHVYREFNTIADALSNEAIDTGGWHGLKTAQGIVEVAVPGLNSEGTANGTAPSGLWHRVPSAHGININRPPPKSVIGGCWTRRNGGVLAANANRPRSPFQVMHRAAALYSSSSMAPPAQSASMRQTGSDSRPRIARMQWGNSPALPGKSIQGSRSGWAEARSWPQSQLKPSGFGCLKWWQAGAAGPWRGGLPACWVGRAAAFTGVWRQGQRPLFSHRSVSCVARGRFATAARVPRPLFVGQCVLRAVSSFAGTRALLCV